MQELLLQDSQMANWQALVHEATQVAHVALGEDMESYLVFVLMRYTETPHILNQRVAPDFLASSTHAHTARRALLRSVGDKCLLFAGLFPGLAKKRNVEPDYYINMGQSAYGTLADLHRRKQRILYANLSQHFVALTDVLLSARQIHRVTESDHYLFSPHKLH